MYIDPKELKIIQWEPTSYCNANCLACPRTDPDTLLTKSEIVKYQRHADPSPFIKSATDVRLGNLNRIVYNGTIGDAMMHPNIDDILISIDRLRPDITQTVHTNAGGPWAKKFEKIANYVSNENPQSNLNFTFSIDGLEDTNHLYRRNVQWKNIMEHIEILFNHNVDMIWRFNKFDHNQHQIEEVEQLAKKWNMKFWLNKSTWGQDTVAKLLNKNKNTDLYKEKVKDNKQTFEVLGKGYNIPYVEHQDTGNDKCIFQDEREIQVVSDLTVWPCCWTSHFHYDYWLDDEKVWNNIPYTIMHDGQKRFGKHLSDIKEWEMTFNKNSHDRNYYQKKDIRITDNHLLYDVLESDTFKDIGNKLYKQNNNFSLQICKETCRKKHY